MRAACVLVMLAACKGKQAEPQAQPQPHATSPAQVADAAPVASDPNWAACEQALEAAPKVPANRRVQSLIDGCRPCGDWTPLLTWDTQQVDGGPTRAAIEQAMFACKAYCDPNAKHRFLGTLDAARGKRTRGPWRYLGEMCKGDVSALPDARYMSAPYFALDRIARAAAARPELAPRLDAIELVMPAVSITGSGFELAKSPVTAPDLGPLALTVTAIEMRIASTPRAKLGKAGVMLTGKGEPYPGALVRSAKELDAAIATLGDGPVTVFAPHGMVASRLLATLAVTGAREVKLAVQANGGPPGWTVAGTIPVTLSSTAAPDAIKLVLGADPDAAIKQAKELGPKLAQGPVTIALAPKTTVAAFAKLVGALVYFDVKTVALVAAK
jgi:hypothetical protein